MIDFTWHCHDCRFDLSSSSLQPCTVSFWCYNYLTGTCSLPQTFRAILVVALYSHINIAMAVLAFFLLNLLFFLAVYVLFKVSSINLSLLIINTFSKCVHARMQLWFREPLTWLALVLPLLIAVVWAAAFYFFKVVPVTEWKVCAIDSNGKREREGGREGEGGGRGRGGGGEGEGEGKRGGWLIFHYFLYSFSWHLLSLVNWTRSVLC